MNLQAQDRARLAFGSYFEGATTDLAVGGKPLGPAACIHDQIEALAAVRALNGLADFHIQLCSEQPSPQLEAIQPPSSAFMDYHPRWPIPKCSPGGCVGISCPFATGAPPTRTAHSERLSKSSLCSRAAQTAGTGSIIAGPVTKSRSAGVHAGLERGNVGNALPEAFPGG